MTRFGGYQIQRKDDVKKGGFLGQQRKINSQNASCVQNENLTSRNIPAICSCTSNKNILTKNEGDLGLVHVSKKYGNKI